MNSNKPISICLSPSSPPAHFLFYVVIFIYVFVTSTISISAASSYSGGNETEHHALLEIKSMITHGSLIVSWNDSLHFCEWPGVICGKRHRRVVGLKLYSQGLEGFLSPHIGNLSFLRKLSLFNNTFQGPVPHELGRLSRLRVLALGSNQFNGVIPTNISGCSNLQKLALAHNMFNGSIPKEISLLSKLTYLSIDHNNLTGGIPPFLGNITSMEQFSVTSNPLGGSIPYTLGHWKNLTEFYSGECDLSGTIPHPIFNLSLLTDFSLPNNQLNGILPPSIGEMLPHLFYLQLRGNQLSGTLPTSISNCSKLDTFDMGDNKFSGKLTIDFAKLIYITFISLQNNNFGSHEADEMKFIDTLKNSTILTILDLSRCKFQGVLPLSICNLTKQLRHLSLLENLLHGNLPRSIGDLVGLNALYLNDNQFTGNIPSTISNLQNLEILALSENQLSGQIPDVIGNLSSLITLALSINMLEGHIPPSLGNCHNLLDLYLDDNKLYGRIPTQVLQLASLSKVLDLSQNNLSGSLPTEVGDMNMLSALDLSYNNLSGNIPNSLGGCTSLSWLFLEGNLFQGMIPPSLIYLKGLVVLDISHNNLSGQIPQFLKQLSLEYLNLSYNDFEGEVPMQGVFSNTSAFFVSGNHRLCGGLVELGLLKCKETKKHGKKILMFVIVILISSILFTIVCLAYVWRKMKKKSQPSESTTREKFMKVSYNQLRNATDGFSDANLIGSGGFSSVYKGKLEDDDKFVAIKVLHLHNRGAQRSFMRECEAWRNIRHRNLLKIITSCSSIDFQGNEFKALIYEFMPNGSLHDWLSLCESTSRLNLNQIISILIDVASALDYIHNRCIPNMVHGDLKPNNILLNEDMVAHVGDFGLTRFLGTISDQNSSTGIRGTTGYVAPEYGLGSQMTCSGDVYSFGIILLEMMTGKRPTNEIFNEGLSLHKFASMALLSHVTDVVDVNILNNYQGMSRFNIEANSKKMEECLASIVKIGVSCSMDSPAQRMNIEKVIHELQRILDTLEKI